MKTKFLAIGLLSAAIAATAVFADDGMSSAPAQGSAVSGQQAPAPADSSAPASSTMSGTGQMSQ